MAVFSFFTMPDTRRAQHVGAVDDQEEGDHQFQQRREENARLREMIPVGKVHDQCDDHRLHQADHQLIDHVGDHVGGDVQSGAMFPFDDGPLPADGLDGIEDAHPDAGAHQGEGAVSGVLRRHEGISPVTEEMISVMMAALIRAFHPFSFRNIRKHLPT